MSDRSNSGRPHEEPGSAHEETNGSPARPVPPSAAGTGPGTGTGAQPGAGRGSGASDVPDDVWDKFLRDSERDIRGSAPKEPSARARRVAARLREQEARNQTPPGWRTGPAWQEMTGRAQQRRRWRAVIGIPLVVAVAVVAMKPSLIPGNPFGAATSDGTSAVAASPLPPETAAPTAPPDQVAPGTPTMDRPFAGSPAERWADGESGIVLPKAHAVAGFSKAQVRKALEQTRTLLVSGSLDLNTLQGSRPKAAFDVLDPMQKDLLATLNTALSAPDKAHDPVALFSRFDPGAVRLAGIVVKTRGRMTLKEGKNGSVSVHADYSFVYPVVRPDDSAQEVTRTVVRRVLDVGLQDPARYMVTPGRIDIEGYRYDASNSACGVFDGYLHPGFSTTGADATGDPATGPTADPYDRSGELDSESDAPCGTASRI
ncbi:hypothetical protein [Streptomyces sp. NPDC008150]|uniref:hypothetical protein n=1 Tax=Streptomyces sp. NPDC008150 TaxID=3364816 RepID=UPI0036E200FA